MWSTRLARHLIECFIPVEPEFHTSPVKFLSLMKQLRDLLPPADERTGVDQLSEMTDAPHVKWTGI
jgi:hypothetical protein